jgi:hypothetical protein
MPNTFHIVNGSYEALIYLDHIHTMPLKNWRKLVKLAAGDDRNAAAMEDVGAWFTAAIADAKEAWKAASQEYVDGWKDPKQRGQKTKNKELSRAVKSAKARHDHLLKMQAVLMEVQAL